ncbi:MAG: DoxX family protein [Pseudonocardiaceae bacterium]
MNVTLWIAQGLLAAVALGGGLAKLAQPRAKLLARMAFVEDFSDGAIKTIGALEVLAAIGLILPGITKIAPVLVPLAAVGLILLHIGAIITHVRRKEAQIIPVNIILIALAAFVAWGRFGPYAL